MSWSRRPLHELVYSIIRREKVTTLGDLLSSVKDVSQDIGLSELKNALIKLEIWDKIDVITEGDTGKIILRSGEGGS